jgi:AraC-like DNA-binding protein
MAQDPEQFIPELPIWALAARLRSASGRSDFGFLTQAGSDISDLGAFGRSISHAPTLLNALEELVREASAHSTSADFWLFWQPNSVLVCRKGMRVGSGSWPIEQYVVMLLINLCRAACGPAWTAPRIFLEHAAPLTRDEAGWLRGSRIISGARATAVEVPARDLVAPMQGYQPGVETDTNQEGTFLGGIRAVIAVDNPEHAPSVVEMAERIGVSSRTLRRKLRDEGWTYRELVRSLRMDQARELLETTDLSVAAVGQLSGYGNPPAFSRAFRAQYGVSPSRYRALRSASG